MEWNKNKLYIIQTTKDIGVILQDLTYANGFSLKNT